jgi:hypothetical protein
MSDESEREKSAEQTEREEIKDEGHQLEDAEQEEEEEEEEEEEDDDELEEET